MELTDNDKINFVNDLLKITKDLAVQHGNPISDHSAWMSVQDVVYNNYPKCCVKYLTGSNWRI